MQCEIRPWQQSDAPALAAALNNPHILDKLRDGLPFPYTEADADAYINEMRTADPDSTLAFAIVAEGMVIGSIGAFRQQNIHARIAEIGYYLAEPYWGQGLGTQALCQVVDYVFTHTDILRVYAEPFAFNTASCRILEKSGFTYEGTLRSNAVKNDVVIDMRMYALLREEWQHRTKHA